MTIRELYDLFMLELLQLPLELDWTADALVAHTWWLINSEGVRVLLTEEH